MQTNSRWVRPPGKRGRMGGCPGFHRRRCKYRICDQGYKGDHFKEVSWFQREYYRITDNSTVC